MAANKTFKQILAKAREAHVSDSMGGLSTGEALAAALVLNRPDWLAQMDYTICQAMDRLDQDWLDLLPAVERAIRDKV